MARNNDRDRGTRRAPKETARRGKKKVCIFCKEHIAWVDYKEIGLLRKFMSDRGKIRARRVSGNCAQHRPRRGARHQDSSRTGAAALHPAHHERPTVASRTGPRRTRGAGS